MRITPLSSGSAWALHAGQEPTSPNAHTADVSQAALPDSLPSATLTSAVDDHGPLEEAVVDAVQGTEAGFGGADSAQVLVPVVCQLAVQILQGSV